MMQKYENKSWDNEHQQTSSSYLSILSHLFESLFLIAKLLLYLLLLGVGFLELHPQLLKLFLQWCHLSASSLPTAKSLHFFLELSDLWSQSSVSNNQLLILSFILFWLERKKIASQHHVTSFWSLCNHLCILFMLLYLVIHLLLELHDLVLHSDTEVF